MAKRGLIVSADEQIRYECVESYLKQKISLLELASFLKLSERQVYRVIARVKEKGLRGIFHGNQGRVPGNQISVFVKKRVQDLIKSTYFDFNCLHLKERLLEDCVIQSNPTTDSNRKRPPIPIQSDH
jgi:hypothetical protein